MQNADVVTLLQGRHAGQRAGESSAIVRTTYQTYYPQSIALLSSPLLSSPLLSLHP